MSRGADNGAYMARQEQNQATVRHTETSVRKKRTDRV